MVDVFVVLLQVDEKPRTLMTDTLVIKNFLHKIVMVHPKVSCSFAQ